MQDQLSRLDRPAAQLYARVSREGVWIEPQLERQRLIVARPFPTGQQTLWAIVIINDQQCQLNFGSGGNGEERTAKLPLECR